MGLFDFLRGKPRPAPPPETPPPPPPKKTPEQLAAEREEDQLRRWGESLETDDPARKFRMLSQLAEEGFPAAQYDLAGMYGHGVYVERNWEKARELYLNCYETIPYAALRLGEMGFGDGWAEERDDQYREGAHFYAIAAGRGLEPAFPGIQELCRVLDGEEFNWIAELFRRELEPVVRGLQARDDAKALDALGLFYQYGLGVDQDLGRAKECFARAAALDPNPRSAAAIHLQNPILQLEDDEDDA